MKLAQLLQILNEKASLMQKFSEVIFIEKEMQEICISFRADSSGMAVLMIGFSITHPCHFPFATTLYFRGACGGVGTLRPTFSFLDVFRSLKNPFKIQTFHYISITSKH